MFCKEVSAEADASKKDLDIETRYLYLKAQSNYYASNLYDDICFPVRLPPPVESLETSVIEKNKTSTEIRCSTKVENKSLIIEQDNDHHHHSHRHVKRSDLYLDNKNIEKINLSSEKTICELQTDEYCLARDIPEILKQYNFKASECKIVNVRPASAEHKSVVSNGAVLDKLPCHKRGLDRDQPCSKKPQRHSDQINNYNIEISSNDVDIDIDIGKIDLHVKNEKYLNEKIPKVYKSNSF